MVQKNIFISFFSGFLALFLLFFSSCSADEIFTPAVQEFRMTSFTEVKNAKYFPQFSEKELRVHKGDVVRIYITNTRGSHDFKIDEFDVYAETPLDTEVMVEFTAHTAGEFIYYCTKPGHRNNGHWGTLYVEE